MAVKQKRGMSAEAKAAAGERMRAYHAAKKAEGVAATNAVQVVEKDSQDNSQLSHYHTFADPWMGAVIEDGWHYVKVTEHHSITRYNKRKFFNMGYRLAPVEDKEVYADWDEAKAWVMRIPQSIYDERVAKSRQLSKEQRNASLNSPDAEVSVQQAEIKKTSLAELLNG